MKISYFALALSAVCSHLSLQADSISVTPIAQSNNIPQATLDLIVQELLAPLKNGFQVNEIITLASTASSQLGAVSTLTSSEKRADLQYVLDQTINGVNLLPEETKIIEEIIPPLLYVLCPDSIDDTLVPPANPTPSEQEILSATNTFIASLNGSLSWKNLPECILYIYQFYSSYPGLTPSDKGYLAKQMLGEIIVKSNSYIPDAIFDELFKRIGYSLIDYLVNKASS